MLASDTCGSPKSSPQSMCHHGPHLNWDAFLDSKPNPGALFLGVVGMVLYLIVGLLYLASGLVVDYPWVFGMWALWLAGLFALILVFKRAPAWTPAVPAAGLALWVLIVQLGSWLFGWSA